MEDYVVESMKEKIYDRKIVPNKEHYQWNAGDLQN